MGKLTCSCLNVKICTRKTDLTAVDITQLGINPECHEFFNQSVAEVVLDLEGITVEHSSLLQQETADDWLIQRCCNCHMYTHATQMSRGSSIILANMDLKGESSAIVRLSSLPEYSHVYKIVLRHTEDNHQFIPQDVHNSNYGPLEATLNEVQHRLNSYIAMEEEAMEKRIRDYESAQRSAFAELQNKARRDKHALLKAVMAAKLAKNNQGNMISEPNGSDTVDGALMPLDYMLSSKGKVKKSSHKVKKISQLSQALQPTVPGDLEDDVLFELDGFQEGSDHPFYESDGDDTDESSNNDEGSVPQINPAMYSTSVPISVPMWHSTSSSGSGGRRRTIDEDDEEQGQPTDPEQIAASIKALARSVHDDGTEIFGDLPHSRRRLTNRDYRL